MYVRRYPDLWLWMHRRWRNGDHGGASVPERGMFPAEAREADVDAESPVAED
jgi:hypothetical protein